STTAWYRTCTCWARRSAAASCRCRRWCPPTRCSACSSQASTAPRSAATRWPGRWGVRGSRCWPPANTRTGPPSWAPTCITGWRGTDRHSGRAGRPHGVVGGGGGGGRGGGVEFASLGGGEVGERLAARGVLAKDPHGTTVRLAPPLMISEEDLDWALDRLEEA